MIYLLNSNALHIPLADETVQCVVTSPPYWGLRDYGIPGQLGLEPTPEEYVANMVAVFREVWRVLRKDGVVWLNLGDSYAGSGQGIMGDGSIVGGEKQRTNAGSMNGKFEKRKANGCLKPKDLVGIPWRVAFALQADGWYLRSDIIWSKPNPMPESVTDRPTKSHEYLFLLAKSQKYYYDQEAVREPVQDVTLARLSQPKFDKQQGGPKDPKNGNRSERRTLENLKERYSKQGVWEDRFTGYELWKEKGIGRNRRTVWTIATAPYSGAHFATFPPDLVRPCILAGTSPRACEVCGAPWERVVERTPGVSKECPKTDEAHLARGGTGKPVGTVGKSGSGRVDGYSTTLGFRPTCRCDNQGTGRCIVLDPFAGTFTVGMVAAEYGRDAIGIELSREYISLAVERTAKARAQGVMQL